MSENQSKPEIQEQPTQEQPKKKENFFVCLRKYGVLATLRTRIRKFVIETRRLYLVKIWGMDIHPDTLISLKVNLDRTCTSSEYFGHRA